MAASLYDYDAPRRRQRQRLQGLYAPPVEPPPPGSEGLYTGQAAGQGGGPDGDQSDANQRDQVHGKAFDQMTMQELQSYASDRARSPLGGLSSLPAALASIIGIKGANFLEDSQLNAELANRGLANPSDFVGGHVAGAANTGMNVAGGVANPELAGRAGASLSNAALDAAEEAGREADPTGGGLSLGANGEMVDPQGLYSRGGKVTRQGLFKGNPPGPDNVIIGAKTGERIINDEIFRGFSDATRKEIDAALKKVKRK